MKNPWSNGMHWSTALGVTYSAGGYNIHYQYLTSKATSTAGFIRRTFTTKSSTGEVAFFA